jgi:DNA mismatch repair protein MutL
MGIIHLLDDQLANQIAAGEVVERPASVVKELVENAIDAGSRHIVVWIEEGGMQKIRVLDDGAGMDADDLRLAFARHATSKIRYSKDLFAIRTLGFRGEALPSIAAVSRLECISSNNEEGVGHRMVLEGGAQTQFELTSCSRGTDIRIADLFFNTPARLKYMKTVQTELSNISDYMVRLALSRPEIAFRLDHNGTNLLDTPGNGELLQTIAAIYGVTTTKRMIQIEATSPDFQLAGWIAKPELTRSNRSAMTMIVNGRYIRNYAMAQAVIAGYHSLLTLHRYPMAILHLNMEPTLIDVNVHPNKLEVRFSKEVDLSQWVQSTIHQALQATTLIPNALAANIEPKRYPQTWGTQRIGASEQLFEKPNSPYETKSYQETIPNVQTLMENRDSPPSAPRFPRLYVMGQLHGSFIIAQNEDGLFLIDQHAAHERIHYEYFLRKFGHPEIASQLILFSHSIELTLAESTQLQQRLPLLEAMGVFLEPFGGHTFKIQSLPSWFPSGQEVHLVEEMIQWLLAEKQPDLMKIREASAIMCSCRASIKANEAQTIYAMEKLLERLEQCEQPFTCPHGRPIVVSFSKRDLDKMFKRVM